MTLQEGPNPVIVKSGDQRKKFSTQDKALIVDGDIIELIPGNYLFKYITVGNEHASSSKTDSSFLRKEKRHSEEESSSGKRHRHSLEDESLERTLQVLF